MGLIQYFESTDAVGVVVAVVLLLMSMASWVVIVLKVLALRLAQRHIPQAIAAFWQAPQPASALQAATAFDSEQWLSPLLQVVQHSLAPATERLPGSHQAYLTRLLRDAKLLVQRRLDLGQVLLATVGSTAPFVGLLGTVWGIYHALSSIAGAGVISIDKVAGPVGEALVMTAAGLAVALPAVLAYNVLGRQIAQLTEHIDGFAFDLRELLGEPAAALAANR